MAFRVLVVDDDQNISDLLTAHLQQRGIEVTIAPDGNAAIQSINKDIPDLIILDISMPGMNGHEVLRRVKQDPLFVNIPILIVTAHTERADVIDALHAGAIDYIVKPFDPEILIDRVQDVLRAARHTILIADNDPLILQLVESTFRHAGFHVIQVSDGKEAWERIFKSLPDLVILDRMMPGLEGLSVLKNMRQEEATKNIPVIILSARDEPRDLENGRKMGAQDYISKPFFAADLLRRSQDLLKKPKE